MDIATRLNNLKAQIEKGKIEVAKAEQNLENLTTQKEQIHAEIKSLGVEPENIQTEIERLEQEIIQGLTVAENLLRG